ncbi:hypothetical protein PENTCL1PPCAC_6410, partial [Pristionchus entomophagus]
YLPSIRRFEKSSQLSSLHPHLIISHNGDNTDSFPWTHLIFSIIHHDETDYIEWSESGTEVERQNE